MFFDCQWTGMDRSWSLIIILEDRKSFVADSIFEPFRSIAFGVSAAAAFILPATGQPMNLTLVNLGTFTGGICFLIGAILLLPERTHPDTPVSK